MRTNLLELSNGDYQVREIKVKLESNNRDIKNEYLVFSLSSSYEIISLNYALEKHKYLNIIEQGAKLGDSVNRQKILDFIETYRTAYNKKELQYIEKVFSDNALIIVGRVLQETDNEDWFKFSKLGE